MPSRSERPGDEPLACAYFSTTKPVLPKHMEPIDEWWDDRVELVDDEAKPCANLLRLPCQLGRASDRRGAPRSCLRGAPRWLPALLRRYFCRDLPKVPPKAAAAARAAVMIQLGWNG